MQPTHTAVLMRRARRCAIEESAAMERWKAQPERSVIRRANRLLLRRTRLRRLAIELLDQRVQAALTGSV